MSGKNYYVVLKVPVRNLTSEEATELFSDAVGFLSDYDLFDEATVESVVEVDSL